MDTSATYHWHHTAEWLDRSKTLATSTLRSQEHWCWATILTYIDIENTTKTKAPLSKHHTSIECQIKAPLSNHTDMHRHSQHWPSRANYWATAPRHWTPKQNNPWATTSALRATRVLTNHTNTSTDYQLTSTAKKQVLIKHGLPRTNH